MTRQFNIGRQNQILMNDAHYDIYKVMEHYLGSKQSINGPVASDSRDPIENGALWLDRLTNVNSPDLKIYNNGEWQIISKEKFQITDYILNNERPTDAIQGQLWIDRTTGVMYYYSGSQWKPISATQVSIEDINVSGFEDFLIVSPMTASEKKVLDNFTSFIFRNNPVSDWTVGKKYEVQDGAVYDLHIYVCTKAHTASDAIPITDKNYWTRIDYLNQFLVPDADVDRFYINGEYVHKKVGMTIKDSNGNLIPDPNETGYTQETNVCITFPVEMVEGKTASAVHVNPKRLNNITKKFFKIDKTNPVIEMPEENTEFYGVYGGLGRLLIKTDNEYTTDYHSAISNNNDCIMLSEKIANTYDFIYAIHYEFTDATVKQPGKVHVKKFKLQDENYIWIDRVDPSKICVFAQGLYYEEDPANYEYDADSGYLYIKEKLQDYDNMVKQFDFSVIAFPNLFRGKITSNTYDTNNYITNKGYRVELGSVPEGQEMLGFIRGVQIHAGGLDINYDPADPTAAYIPLLTQKFVEDNKEVYWCIAETGDYDSQGNLVHEMYRGKTTAIRKDPHGIVVPIYRDENNPVRGALHLKTDEIPLLWVDGVLVYQKELEIANDYITIYGLKEGQEVVMLADKASDDSLTASDDYRANSDRLIFEDTVSYATIPTELNDSVLVFYQNGILCDAGSVYTSIKPKEAGYHGEIRYWINYTESKWLMFNAYSQDWEVIPDSELVLDVATGQQVPFIDVLDKNSRGYSSTRKSISFLQNLGQDFCTYYAYVYADSIEKKLLMDYCYPNGIDGVNIQNPQIGDPIPFTTNFKHVYTPGKNEITVYLNGVRQNLDSPYDVNFSNSKNKECSFSSNNEFYLAIDDGTDLGKAINGKDGYYIYKLTLNNNEKVVIKETEMTDAEKQSFERQGYKVEKINEPTKNVIFYVIEQCETGEQKACNRKVLTYKDALASKGAYANNTYTTGDFLLTTGNVRVFVNGIRQPFGIYQDLECQQATERKVRQAYRLVDAHTIEFQDILIGGIGGNEGDSSNPLYPIGDIILPDGSTKRAYHEVIDEIVIEMRRDYKLREVTIPIKDNTGEFSIEDGIPADLFKTKDKVMIYINGLAYGKEYKIENQTIKLTNDEIRNMLGNSKNDVITFEWR